MDAPAYGRSPRPREEAVSFAEEGPFLVARHYYDYQAAHRAEHEDSVRAAASACSSIEGDKIPIQGSPPPPPTATLPGEEEDDSLAVVFSSDTGAGRAHTPQRLNRTHTPQR